MTTLRCVDRRVHTAVLTPRSAAYTIAALCFFLGACNIPVLSPDERAAIDTIGPAIARQEQANNKIEALTAKVEANVQAGRDANIKQEQSLAKIDANLKAQDVAVAQFKGEIAALKVVTSQSAGRDQTNPTQTGLLNFFIQASRGRDRHQYRRHRVDSGLLAGAAQTRHGGQGRPGKGGRSGAWG